MPMHNDVMVATCHSLILSKSLYTAYTHLWLSYKGIECYTWRIMSCCWKRGSVMLCFTNGYYNQVKHPFLSFIKICPMSHVLLVFSTWWLVWNMFRSKTTELWSVLIYTVVDRQWQVKLINLTIAINLHNCLFVASGLFNMAWYKS